MVDTIGMRYLGGWGGDFDSDVSSAQASQGQVFDMLVRRMRQRSRDERESVYKKWKQRYESMAQALFEDEDCQKMMQEDTYLKKVRKDLNLA